MSPPRGALLINLGTPDAPHPRDVRRYLREFLSDPRVIDLPTLPRKLLVEGWILPTRPRRTAAAYAKVWSEAGSPLLVHSEALRTAVARELGSEWAVALGMRYGRPSIERGLRALEERGVREVIALPLFPQLSSAATASALAALFSSPAAARLHEIRTVPPFYDDPGFVSAWRDVAAPPLAAFGADHVLFSYHGLPERQIRAADRDGAHCLASSECCAQPGRALLTCYRAQCYATTDAIVRALALDPARASTSFQSRLGRTPWIHPFTDFVLPELAASGVRRLAISCPSFVADCLETVEEIGIRAREQWRRLGGEELLRIDCPNAHPTFVDALAGSYVAGVSVSDSLASGLAAAARALAAVPFA